MPDAERPALPICVDCQHHIGHSSLCGHPRLVTWNKVAGTELAPKTCEYERSRIWQWLGLNTCGPAARYFQRRSRVSAGRP